MNTSRNVYLGIVEIIIGILIIILPLTGLLAMEIITGLTFLFLSIAWLIFSFEVKNDSRIASIILLIMGIIALISSIGFFTYMITFDPLVTFWVIFGGLLLIIFSIMTLLFRRETSKKLKFLGILGIILGVIYILIGLYAINPFYLAVLIGIFLITDGIALLFIKPSRVVESVVNS